MWKIRTAFEGKRRKAQGRPLKPLIFWLLPHIVSGIIRSKLSFIIFNSVRKPFVWLHSRANSLVTLLMFSGVEHSKTIKFMQMAAAY